MRQRIQPMLPLTRRYVSSNFVVTLAATRGSYTTSCASYVEIREGDARTIGAVVLVSTNRIKNISSQIIDIVRRVSFARCNQS